MDAVEVERKKRWLSYSGISQFRGCPQQWYYSRVLELEKIVPDIAVERDFGSWWHALMAADSIERGNRHSSLVHAPEWIEAAHGIQFRSDGLVPSDVLDATQVAWQRMGQGEREEWENRLGEDLPARLEAVYSRWLEQWESARAYERPLAVEVGWGRDLPGAEARLVGYIDEGYVDTRRNVVAVRDHKTSKALGTQSTADDMMDSQLQFYAWGAAPLFAEWKVGPIQATAYDRVRTIKPKTPVLTQAGSLSKQVTDFDLRTYLEWAEPGVPFPGRFKDGSGAGVYQPEKEVIERLSSPVARSVWFQRTMTPLNGNLIRTHLQAAVDTAQDIDRLADRIEERQEAPRNLGGGCRWCDFAALCRAQMFGGPHGDYDLAACGVQRKAESRKGR